MNENVWTQYQARCVDAEMHLEAAKQTKKAAKALFAAALNDKENAVEAAVNAVGAAIRKNSDNSDDYGHYFSVSPEGIEVETYSGAVLLARFAPDGSVTLSDPIPAPASSAGDGPVTSNPPRSFEQWAAENVPDSVYRTDQLPPDVREALAAKLAKNLEGETDPAVQGAAADLVRRFGMGRLLPDGWVQQYPGGAP